jgi:hypothetical protein
VPGYARALPHWTVAEFFEKLELLMGCEFDIDHRQQRITFAFSRTVLDALAPIEIESVVDSYSCEVNADSSDNSCDYIGAKNLVFKECSHEMWKYYSCDWLIESFRNNNLIREYNTLKELIAALYDFSCYEKVTLRNTEAYYIHHAKDVDMYFCIKILRKESQYDTDKKKMRWYYYCALQPINQFGGHIVSDDDDATETEVEFVPAWIDDTDSTYGKCLFLDPASYDEETGEEDDDTTTLAQPYPVATLIAGEKDRSSEYYSVIYVAWWDGNLPMLGKMPFPAIDAVEILDWKYFTHDFSLRINRSFNSDETNLYKYNIEPTHKYTFKFLANEIPNARALFIIEGKRYLAEKITATFTESGMSQLIKGTFYRVI